MTEHEEYLNRVKEIVIEAEEEIAKQALDFNIFHTLDVIHDELKMCRVLYEFLNPKGGHGRGAEYLRCFLKDILKYDDIDDDELKKAKVVREYVISNTGRRIDIYINTPYRAIPIEVKIGAGDQDNQCRDYYRYAERENGKKSKDKKWGLVYLTLYGTMPSQDSTGKDKDCIGRIKAISWSVDILKWMRKMIGQSSESNTRVREITTQYIDAIEELTNQKKGLVYKKMKKMGLFNGKDNMKAAQAISEEWLKRKIEFMEDLFNKVQERVEKEVFPDGKADKIDFGDEICDYYQKTSRPSLNYLMKDFHVQVQGGEEIYWLLLCFEIDRDVPCVSLFLTKYIGMDKCGKINYKSDYDRTDEICKEVESYISDISREKIKENLKKGWRIDWLFVPTNSVEGDDSLPNFKKGNDAYFDLYEEKQLDAFVDSVVAGMMTMKNRIKDA